MSQYSKIRQQALLLLNNTTKGDLITEPDELASYFELSFQEFIKHVYTKRIAELLAKNKAAMKASIRRRWFGSSQVKAQENLYKLLANNDELSRLKGEGQQVTESGTDPLLEVLKPQDIWSE